MQARAMSIRYMLRRNRYEETLRHPHLNPPSTRDIREGRRALVYTTAPQPGTWFVTVITVIKDVQPRMPFR